MNFNCKIAAPNLTFIFKQLLRLNTTLTHNGKDFVIHNQYWRCYVYNASATVFRRDAFFPDDDFAECFKMRNSGDWLFWSIMAAKGDVIEIYKKLNLIRRHNSNQTETGIKNGNIFFDAMRHELGITKFEYFLERIHKAFFNIIPNLISMNNDRL